MDEAALDIHGLLKSLSAKRPLFDSEKDFQLHLAWEMKERGYEVRLEYDPICFDANAAIDILVVQPERVAVELKYKTRLLAHECAGQAFALKNQAAEDVARYDFWKDVWRLERVVSSGKASRGYAIFLTNNGGYWREGRAGTADADFRMNEERVVTGKLGWAGHASAGTMKGREEPLLLTGQYEVRWTEYSQLNVPAGEFRFLMLDVLPQKVAVP